MFTMHTIARGFCGLDHCDIAWTDHTGTATQYLDLAATDDFSSVRRFLEAQGVQNARIVIEETEVGGSTYRVDVPELVA